MEKITVVKIGGNVIDDPAALRGFLADFASLPGAKILVHGGGKLATRLAQKLELQVQMVDGRRITDKGTLDIVTMVYAGLVNKQLVAGLQAAGCNALGLSGADGNAVMARRRAPEPIDYGFVGDIESVNHTLLGELLGAGVTPVFCAIMHDGQGTLLNCNADSVASSVALSRLRMSEMLFSTFLMRLLGVVSSPWKMLHLCIVNVSEVIIKTVFIKKRKVVWLLDLEGCLACVTLQIKKQERKCIR